MKRTLILIITILCVFASNSCKSQKKVKNEKPIELTTEVEKAAYSLGVNLGNNFKQQGLDTILDLNIVVRGLLDQKDNKSQITAEEAEKVLQSYFQKLQEEQTKAMSQEGKKFLEENAKKEGIKTTASGLQYEVITMGTGAKPTATDKVKVHYEGSLINGKVFDSSYKRGEPISFPLNGVIKGWTEGLQLMPVGSKFKFYIPQELGYGERGSGQDIPPYSTLIFVVELLDIEK